MENFSRKVVLDPVHIDRLVRKSEKLLATEWIQLWHFCSRSEEIILFSLIFILYILVFAIKDAKCSEINSRGYISKYLCI